MRPGVVWRRSTSRPCALWQPSRVMGASNGFEGGRPPDHAVAHRCSTLDSKSLGAGDAQESVGFGKRMQTAVRPGPARLLGPVACTGCSPLVSSSSPASRFLGFTMAWAVATGVVAFRSA